MEKIIFLLTFVFQLSWTFLTQEQDFSLGTHIAKPFRMTISNALPVQFWDEAEETFNEKQVCGIDQICWCMPWHCADTIPFQFTDDFVVVEPEPEEVTEDAVLPALSTGENLAGSFEDWTEGATPSVILPESLEVGVHTEQSDKIIWDYAFIAGDEYEITFDFTATENQNLTARFYLLDSLNNEEYTDDDLMTGLSGSVSFIFTATAGSVKYGLRLIRFTLGPIDENTITITSMSGTHTYLEEPEPAVPPDPIYYKLQVLNSSGDVIQTHDFESTLIDSNTYLYELPFNPQEQELCDDQVSFQIIDSDASPDSVIKKSDCLQIKESIDCTLAIDYSNNKNFNGLIFEDISPSTTFRIRIPARFFTEDNPSEQEDLELSNSEIVRLYNKLEERRQLEISFVPHYMHRKIQLALMCDNVTIDEKQWIRRETYEKVEGRKTYPLKRANVWLHDKDFIKENQL